MSDLFDKQVDAQKEKTFGVHTRKAHEKCMMKMKLRNKQEKNDVHIKMLNVIDKRKHFVGRIRKTGKINNFEHNEGTICLVNG